MTPGQIAAWAASGESEMLEFMKSTAEKDRACRTLCAFANGQGGRLLFGVTPSGKAVGQTVADNTLEELAREFQGSEPPLFPLVERVDIAADEPGDPSYRDVVPKTIISDELQVRAAERAIEDETT